MRLVPLVDRTRVAWLALAGFLVTAGPVVAAESRIARPVTDAPAPATQTPTQSVRTIPLPAIENPMREMSPGVYEGIVPIQRPDGSWIVHLDERFHAFSVARLGASGRVMGSCVHNAAGLAQWRAGAVRGPQGAVPAKWEDR
jgi:hypothetical protein